MVSIIEYILILILLFQIRTALMGSSNQTVTDAASIVEGGQTLKSKRELLQIIDTTLLKCYLQVDGGTKLRFLNFYMYI